MYLVCTRDETAHIYKCLDPRSNPTGIDRPEGCFQKSFINRVEYINKKGTRTLKPSISWFKAAYSSRFDAHGLMFRKCRETLM